MFDSTDSPRKLLGCLGLLVVVAAVIVGGKYYRFEEGPSAVDVVPPTPRAHREPPLPGEAMLVSYGQAETRPEGDLIMMAHIFSNLMLVVKGDAPFRMGANEEFAAALMGKNRDGLRFLPEWHRCFNAQGQIVDRWMTPLFFHVNDRSHIDIRSAGPDQKMWTEDDLHRRYDGQFLHGKELNARSLDEVGRNPGGR